MAKIDWNISLIPQGATNSSDPLVASEDEIKDVINNPSLLSMPKPIESEVEAAPRYNANVPYSPEPVVFSYNDQILLKAIRKAVKNGWKDYHRFANDAVTIGMEAERAITGMKKGSMKVEELLYDKTFARCLWLDDWQTRLSEMVVADNLMNYLKEHLDD